MGLRERILKSRERSIFLNPGTRVRYEDAVEGFDDFTIEIDCRVAVGDFPGRRPRQGKCTCGRGCDKK